MEPRMEPLMEPLMEPRMALNDVVDGVFVITLNTDADRRQKLLEWLPHNAQFFVVKRMRDPERGCFRSHQKVLAYAKQRGLRRVLVLEDDAFPLTSMENVENITRECLEDLDALDPKWSFLMLGYLPIRMHVVSDRLYKVRCAYDGHAYIINVPNVNVTQWKNVPVDGLYFCGSGSKREYVLCIPPKKNASHVYASRPMLFTQKTLKSNIDPTHLSQSTFFELFGGENAMAEASSHVNVFYAGILILVSAALLVVAAGLFAGQQHVAGGVFIGLAGIIVLAFGIAFIADTY